MNAVPDSFEFAVSPDGRQFAIWEPGNEPWFAPEANMHGRWITSADMDRLGWVRYTPQTADGRAEALREAAQRLYTALFPAVYDDMGQKATEGVNRAASELRRMADEAATEKATPTGEATPDFFKPGRTYRSRRCGDFRFRCLALDTHPDTGVLRAFGWRYSARPDVWRPADLDANDWACCGWTDDTEGGDAR